MIVLVKTPTSLYNDIDDLMDWEHFYALNEEDTTIKEELEMAILVSKYKSLRHLIEVSFA